MGLTLRALLFLYPLVALAAVFPPVVVPTPEAYLEKVHRYAPLLEAPNGPVKKQVTAYGVFLADRLQPLTSDLGCPKLGYGCLAPQVNLISLEFIPTDESIEQWKHLTTATCYGVGPIGSESAKILPKICQSIKSAASSEKTILRQKDLIINGEPSIMMEYTIGTQPGEKEHNCGILYRVDENYVAFIQIQRRSPLTLSKAEINQFFRRMELPELIIP